MRHTPVLLLLFACAGLPVLVRSMPHDSLRVVTINVWSGLDYAGTSSMGEYESPDVRERRFLVLLDHLRLLVPHVILVQEANPVGRYACRLADSLGFDVIHQVCHAGVKVGGLGFPTNLDEGIATLAAPALQLRYERAEKVGGAFGLHGSAMSLHFSDAAGALEGSFIWNGRRVYCINVHLLAVPPAESSAMFDGDPDAAARLHDRMQLKSAQFDALAEFVERLPAGAPVIVGGDFNCSSGDSDVVAFIRRLDLRTPVNFSDSLATWDPCMNPNIRFSTASADARGEERVGYDRYSAQSDTIARRLDYVLFRSSGAFGRGAVESLVLADPISGVTASDHYGVAVAIPPDPDAPPDLVARQTPRADPAIEAFPILSYDTDAGFGYGGKGFLLNQIGLNESIDLTLFNSTKGERWYRLVVSLPDLETRQRTVYSLAVDLIIDYDKYMTNSFFGLGNSSRFEDREYYTREPLEISVLASRGVSESFVLQGGLRFHYVANRGFPADGRLAQDPHPLTQSVVRAYAVVVSARYDNRNSVVEPSFGWVIEGEGTRAPFRPAGGVVFTRFHLLVQRYTTLFLPTTVLALRAKLQAIEGDVPVQLALPLGGNNTLRGFVQDRFLGQAVIMANAEIRFPVFWRVGGVVGIDAGIVWPTLSAAQWTGWRWNPTAGLRFSMDTFVVRCDVGFGPETTGLYLNFGHIF